MYLRSAFKKCTRFYSAAVPLLKNSNGIGFDVAALRDSGRIIKALSNDKSTTITFVSDDLPDGKPYTVAFNNLFLRDSSRSPKSVDPTTGQKLLTTSQLSRNPLSTTPISVQVTPEGKFVSIKWEDGDSYNYPLEFIYKFKGSSFVTESMRITSPNPKTLFWDEETLNNHRDEVMGTDYEAYTHDDNHLYQLLRTLQKFGIVFINGVPQGDHGAIKKIAERIGPIRNTFYGETFDVKGANNETPNIAYSNLALPLHMDLLYMENVPEYQLLHTINNPKEGSGGVNVFVDGFRAANEVRELDTISYQALQNVPINYHYSRGDKRYYQSKPMIEHHESHKGNTLDDYFDGLIKAVNYSPPFQAPFTFGIHAKSPESDACKSKLAERHMFNDFTNGLELFEDCITDKSNQFEIKLPPNSCVILDNRRVLHARSAYSSDSRWIKGCYMDKDTIISRLNYLREKFL
ncbi:ZYRO0G01342p [Zygosaccharomyces rouxii]|uniref:ZYRO0G01342p n=1 Tax=Zygosaccharomyces rouxii (strain ATCC 2623 / CBS 732 / NBRC 1130 / NCYC 568 / NRRL Y-229) TaxID=559307 RepID=C5E1T6_ZYGRC|nr:uncharacterized protein ZYRO0G01342g [Zygosaccharomyces rouxii]KAH9202127.1 taurine catabolism dioxygenase TauD, TfdA family-domain-containing protein [Zygosaccharomyces rouxii]CAR29129.1 ZYRO0G01342p [Zygosaccharomyces rouxii]